MTDSNEPAEEAYDEPVASLLTIGDPRGQKWPDYPADYGLGKEHVPALLEMVHADKRDWSDPESPEPWVAVHAWRALGQLQAEEAVEGLLDLFYRTDEWDDHWMMNEMPRVMALMGPGALPALDAYLADSAHGLWARTTAANSIAQIARAHPAAREQAVTIIADQLAQFATQEPDLNASLVAALTDLEAVEAGEVMAAAFDAGRVDLSVQGDWEEVQIRLGLLEERLTPPPEEGWVPELFELRESVRKAAVRKELEEELRRQEWGKVGRNEPCPLRERQEVQALSRAAGMNGRRGTGDGAFGRDGGEVGVGYCLDR